MKLKILSSLYDLTDSFYRVFTIKLTIDTHTLLMNEKLFGPDFAIMFSFPLTVSSLYVRGEL